MCRNWNRVLLIVSLLVLAATSDDAFARRFGRRSSSTVSYSSGGIKSVAPTVDSEFASYRVLNAHFSYDKAMQEEYAFTDRVRIFVLIRDPQLLKSEDPKVVEVKLTDLSNSKNSHVGYFPVMFRSGTDDYQLVTIDVANTHGEAPIIEPAKVYRMYVNFHKEGDSYGKETVLGRIRSPYYVATADDSRLGRARQHIAMRTFKEFYFAEQGWRSEESYPMDCYAYYTWAAGSVTVGAQNGRAILDRLFGHRRPFQNGSAIRSLAKQGPIHGDYVRIPGHSFMLLAYDEAAGHVWTMEGNFNSTIEIVIRSVDSGWTVGHLVEEHIQPSLFQYSRAEPAGSQVPL